jgi:phytase-like protein
MGSPLESPRIERLDFEDETLCEIATADGALVLLRGLGSGLTRRPGDAPGIVWALGDRGPNLPTAKRRVKVMPTPQFGPTISELCVDGHSVQVLRSLPLRGRSGRAISGLPLPGEEGEVAVDLHGVAHAGDPSGADTEGIAASRDGGFWIADEYGPSLLRTGADGTIEFRWIPVGSAQRFVGADYPVIETLPSLAASRRLNRGFEGIALAPDERSLYVAFQSALEGEAAKHGVRLWQLDVRDGRLLGQWHYPFDEPFSFLRDGALGPFEWPDLKVCELVCVNDARLLVLERGSATTKLYSVTLDEKHTASAASPLLVKSLLLNSDEHPEIGVDIEGVALLSPRTLLLVNDNDFGVEGVTTKFWRVELPTDV